MIRDFFLKSTTLTTNAIHFDISTIELALLAISASAGTVYC